MKTNIILTGLILLLVACKKNEVKYGAFEVYNGDKSLLKLNYVSPYTLSRSVQFKLDGKRYGALLAYRYPYPGGGFNTNGASSPEYIQVEPGSHEFSISLPFTGSSNDSSVLYTGTITLDKGKNYSLHVTDTAGNIKHVLLTDNVEKPASGTARYKLVNLIPNIPSIDLYLGDSVIAKNLNYLASTDYFVLNVPQASTRPWNVRVGGSASTSTVIATYTSASTFANQRVYTIFTLGYKDKTTTAQRPYVSFFLER